MCIKILFTRVARIRMREVCAYVCVQKLNTHLLMVNIHNESAELARSFNKTRKSSVFSPSIQVECCEVGDFLQFVQN